LKTLLDFQGVVCPVITPFDERDDIDFECCRRVVDFLITNGIHGVMIAGTTGEGPLLSTAERKQLCEHVVDYVSDRIPVIAHTGCLGTAESIELTRHASSAGATAAAVVAPFFFTFDDDSLFDHFIAIAEAVPDFPIFLYSIPGNAKNDISPMLLERLLREAPNIAGIKSSNPDMIRLQQYIDLGGEDFLTFCGVDSLMLPAMVLGAKGQVSGNANVFPEVFCELHQAFSAGDMEHAKSLQRTINQMDLAFKNGITPAFYKTGLELRGISTCRVRAPMRELTTDEAEQLVQQLSALKLL
jgi:4-hydroxy-tetrahydrodipicolinate synthase